LKPGKFWAARDSDRAGAWLEIALPTMRTFDVIRLSEDIRLGVRVDDYAVDVFDAKGWREVARHTSIGHERLIRLPAPVTASKVRLRILTAAASPVIGNFGLFLMPPVLEEPVIRRDAKGMVTITATGAGQNLFYTVDGSEPAPGATVYQTPFAMTRGGIIKAIARDARTGVTSAATTVELDVSPVNWTVIKSNIDTPEALLKGETFTGPDGQPIEAVIDLGETLDIKGFVLAPPVQNISLGIDRVNRMGPPAGYEVWVSADGTEWGDVSAEGEFSNIAANRTGQRIRFATPKAGRYVRIRLPHAVQDKPVIAVGKIGIITR
jgi:alpha-L-fucosidase